MAEVIFKVKVDEEKKKDLIDILENAGIEYEDGSAEGNSEKIDWEDIAPNLEELANKLEKIKTNDAYLYDGLIQLVKRIMWTLNKKNVHNHELLRFIYTVESEIKMRYAPYKKQDILLGSVVICNYGRHINGEAEGCIPAIVCNKISGNMVFLVPIIFKKNIKNDLVIGKNDIISEDSSKDYTGYCVKLKKGRYINKKRIQRVIGCTKSVFFNKILQLLKKEFDFTGSANTRVEEETIEKKEMTALKLTYTEKSLLKFTSKAWKILETDEEPEKKLDKFLSKMGMLESEEDQIIKRSFIIAIILDRVTYPNLLTSLKKNYYRNESENNLQKNLKKRFNKWLERNSSLKEEAPRVSLTDVLGLFKKLWNN